MEFAQPPPDVSQVNFSMPPPPTRHPNQHGNNLVLGGGGGGGHHHHYHHHFGGGMGAGKPGHPYFKQFGNFGRGPNGLPMTQDDFDGKRLRKSVMRKTVDYNASIVRALENRVWQRDFRDRHALQPESIYVPELMPPPSYLDNPSNAVTTKFVKTATNKMRCPIFTLAWTPEGRRLVTGASSGEFTLWNGLTFNFETILQAHDVPVRTMVWSHNDIWMVTGDHSGCVKYWQSNMNNVKMFQAHKEPIRGISFSPSDSKFVSCSDDGTLRVWDFYRCQEERVLRGHGADVKCVHWHPQKALIVSGSKDNQQPIKLWDPKSGQALATLHAHKSTVMDLKWNDNGNWLVTASRDHLLKLFDLRNLREEVQIFRGHKKEASAVSWHPVHEGLFCSGGSDGSILFWNVGTDKEVGAIDQAHDSIVWTLAWHPLGHILCSGSNDHTIKFWTRNRPGDQMRDKYNLNTLPASWAGMDECDIEEHHIIPGMGPEDKVDFTESLTADKGFIPGLDLDQKNIGDDRRDKEKKVPYSKPIPRNFQAQWNDTGRAEDAEESTSKEIKEVITQIAEKTPGAVPLQKIAPSAIIVYGKMVEVIPGSNLESAILAGPDALNKYISSGEITEIAELIPFDDNSQGSPTPSGRTSPTERSRSPVRRKKSRFDSPHDHNAQMVYSNDVDARLQIQPQAAPSNASQFIPPLLALNVSQPDGYAGEAIPKTNDQDYRGFNSNEFIGGNDNARSNPWSDGPPPNQPQNPVPNFGPGGGGVESSVIGSNAIPNMPLSNTPNNSGNFNFANNLYHGTSVPFDGPYNNNNNSNNGPSFMNNGPSNFGGNGNGPSIGNFSNNKDNNSRDNWSRNNDGGSYGRNHDNYNRNDSRNNRDGGRRNDRNNRSNNRRNRSRF